MRDLDLVRADAWPEALEILDAAGLLASSYVRWWLAGAPVLGGRRPRALRVPGTDPLLAGLYEDAPGDPARAALLGARSSLADVLADEPDELLELLADPSRTVGRAQLRALHAAVAEVDVEPPARVRAVVDGTLQVVPAEDAVVVDRPDLLPRVAPYAVVPVPLDRAVALAEALDLALASEVVPDVALPGEGRLVRHERLVVPDAGGQDVEVDWVVTGDVDHVVGLRGQSRAAAWRLGDWSRRHELLARLRGEADDGEGDLDPVRLEPPS